MIRYLKLVIGEAVSIQSVPLDIAVEQQVILVVPENGDVREVLYSYLAHTDAAQA